MDMWKRLLLRLLNRKDLVGRNVPKFLLDSAGPGECDSFRLGLPAQAEIEGVYRSFCNLRKVS